MILRRFSDKYAFTKPNDRRALDLMNAAAKAVMTDWPDVVIAYGISDEYRYLFLRTHFCRRVEKDPPFGMERALTL